MYAPNDLVDLATTEVAAKCREAAARSRRAQPADDRFCFDLFRRALTTQDQVAWAALHTQYEKLVRHWIGASRTDADDLTNEVFFRFWQRFADGQFEATFGALANVLAYLRVCARSVVINQARRDALDSLLQPLDEDIHGTSLDDRTILEKLDHEELLSRVYHCCQDERERVIVDAAFVQGMKPQEIRRAHPELYANAADVSRVKERVVERCRRRLT